MVRFDETEKSWDHTAHGFMEVGTIQKWSLAGVDNHPWHIHINSFQLAGRVWHVVKKRVLGFRVLDPQPCNPQP
jgi:FtsP/CotA-like multicopper oxidase with cupredoxin domain